MNLPKTFVLGASTVLFALAAAAANAQGPSIEFANKAIEFAEDDEAAAVSIRLVNCPARTPSGVATVRVVAAPITTEGNAAQEGIDFFAFGHARLGSVPGRGTASASSTRVFRNVDLPIEIVHDETKESVESFLLQLQLESSTLHCGEDEQPVTVGQPVRISLLDVPKDQSMVGFAATEINVTEGDNENTRLVQLEVHRSGGSMPVSVICQTTRSGSASESEDYEPTAEVLGWGEGDSQTQVCTVPVLADDLPERRETVTLALVAVSGELVLGNANATVFINDDDSPGRIQFQSAEFRVQESESQASIVVERRGGNEGAFEVQVSLHPRGATPGEDYTVGDTAVRWQHGEEGARTVIVSLIDDDVVEEEESLFLSLSSESGAPLGDFTSSVLRILDDDAKGATVETGSKAKPSLVRAAAPQRTTPTAAPIPAPTPAPTKPQPTIKAAPKANTATISKTAPSNPGARPKLKPEYESLPGSPPRHSARAQTPPEDAITVGPPRIDWSPAGLKVEVELENWADTTRTFELELVIKKNLEPQARLRVELQLEPKATRSYSHLFTRLPRGSYTVTHFVRER